MQEQFDTGSWISNPNTFSSEQYLDIELFESTVDVELENDSEKIFFNSDKCEEIELSPRMEEEQFEKQNYAFARLLEQCMKPLIEKIEEQSCLLNEKENELKQISMQLKLLPDLERQRQQSDIEMKLKHFENQALKKQLSMVKEDRKSASEVTKLSNELIRRIEDKARIMQEELQILRKDNEDLQETNEELFEIKQSYEELKEQNSRLEIRCRPWWQKLFAGI